MSLKRRSAADWFIVFDTSSLLASRLASQQPCALFAVLDSH